MPHWQPTTDGYRHPLAVWLVWHGVAPSGALSAQNIPLGREMAKALYRMFGGEWLSELYVESPLAGALRPLAPVEMDVPLFFLETDNPDLSAIDSALASQPAERCVVVLLIDSAMTQARHLWKPVVNGLYRTMHDGKEFRVVGVNAGGNAIGVFPETREQLTIPFDPNVPEEIRGVYVEVLGILCKSLIGYPLPKVFISHAKVDGEPIASDLHSRLQATSVLESWFDRARIGAGDSIGDMLRDALPHCAFLAIVTEEYVRRRWTRWEASMARHYDRPVVVIDAVERMLRRLPPEFANAPLLRWPFPDGVDLSQYVLSHLLAELLRQNLHRAQVDLVGALGLHSPVPTRPVLLPPGPPLDRDSTGEIRIYADPPIPQEELALLSQGDRLEYLTLTQHLAECGWRDGNPSGGGSLSDHRVAISVSGSPASRGEGLHQEQIDDLAVRLVRGLVTLGAEIAYGGDLRPEGLTLKLARIVEQYAPERLVADVLYSYVAWPLHLSWNAVDEADRLRFSNPIKCAPPTQPLPLSAEQLDALREPVKMGEFLGTRDGQLAFSRALAGMRREMTADCAARVAIGGPSTGFKGRLPGILEEVLLALRARQPVYLVAGFGGVTRQIYDCLGGVRHRDLSLPIQIAARPEYGTLIGDLAATEDAIDWDGIVTELEQMGLDGLADGNGLDPDENAALATTRNPLEIVYWVSKGLAKRFGGAAAPQ